MKRLTDMDSGLHRFFERIEPLERSGKLGPVFWQLPPHFERNDLGVWAGRIEEWRRDRDVYAYFNNDWSGHAVENARWIRERLASS